MKGIGLSCISHNNNNNNNNSAPTAARGTDMDA